MDFTSMSISPQHLQPSAHGPGGSSAPIKLEPLGFVKLEAQDFGGVKLEPDFEPLTRARSNTWPQPRPEEPSLPQGGQVTQQENDGMGQSLLLGFTKKSTSRRNAWGNMSYADLITQAIQSSPDKRLTLSQIYDWMVTNVSYFKDKGDSNSSAGWKNSIRHNLSLHNRFMRVQNEGTGKSSWWMLNPDAKPGKAARRQRATSMETSKFEKKRGRIKKKIEAMKNGGSILDTPSPSSSLSEGLDLFPDSPHQVHNFNLSPSDFRGRTSSNASSCGGRLSPILGEVGVERHHHDNSQGPPISSWDYANYGYGSPGLVGTDRFATEQLALGLANTMKLQESSAGVSSYDFHQQSYQSPQVIGGRQGSELNAKSNIINSENIYYHLQQKFNPNPIYSDIRTQQGQEPENENIFRGFAGGTLQNGGYRRPPTVAIPTTIKNDRVAQSTLESHLLNGIYGTTFLGTQPSFLTHNQTLLQQVENKGMSSIHHAHADLDFNVDVETHPFECNVDEVLRSEPGILRDDFDDFGPNPGASNQQTQNVTMPCSPTIAPGSPFQSTVHHHHQQQSNGRQWTSVLH